MQAYIVYGSRMDELKQYIDKVGVAEFARKMGCSTSLVYHVLNGRRSPSKDFARKAEEISGGYLRKEQLLWGTDSRSPSQ